MTTKRMTWEVFAAAGVLAWVGISGASAASDMGQAATHQRQVFGAEHAPVPDGRLAQMRGGSMRLPEGIVSIGVSVVGDIRGDALEDSIEFTFNKRVASNGSGTDPLDPIFKVNGTEIPDGEFRDPGDGVRVTVDGDEAASVQTLVQTGAGTLQGSVINSSARGVLTAVQNNLNNIDIDVTNRVDIRTNGNIGATGISDALSRVADGVGY